MSRILDRDKRDKEKEELNKMIECIDNWKSFYVDAGAGSGKTYTLNQLIGYILSNKKDKLRTNSQKILCITYTNVAANEIKSRIRLKEFVTVSTIHDFLWSVIRRYQKEIKEVHVSYVKELITDYEIKIKGNGEYIKIDETKRDLFKDCFRNQTILNEYFKIYTNKKEFWVSFLNTFITSAIGISDYVNNNSLNLGNMKELVKGVIKSNQLIDHIEEIEAGIKNIMIKYDQNRSTDRLHKGKFSHDTLLLYFKRLIDKKEMLKRKIVNKYPYMLIDEYQDTSINVIESFIELKKYSDIEKNKCVLAFLGDPSQSIYTDGIGDLDHIAENYNASQTDESCKVLKLEKKYNRRSKQEIISLSNKFRYDKSEKESIYQDFNGAKIFFEQIDSSVYIDERYNNLIDKVIDEMGSSDLNILVTRNAFIAGFYKFDIYYNLLRSFPKYSGANYNELNSKFFNKDKFEKDLELIWDLIKLYSGFVKGGKLSSLISLNDIRKYSTTVEDIVNMKSFIDTIIDCNNLSLDKWLDNLYKLKNENLTNAKAEPWSELLEFIISSNLNFKEYDEYKYDLYNSLSSYYSYGDTYSIIMDLQNKININYSGDMEDKISHTINAFEEDDLNLIYPILKDVDNKSKLIEYIIGVLNKEGNLDIINGSVGDSLDELYSVNIIEFYNWYSYITDITQNDALKLSTLHGSKGKTLKNVLLILNKGYRSNTREYESILVKLINGEDTAELNSREKESLNLIYVAISRAVDNIYIVYNDLFEKADELRSFFVN